jgi:hypothetical protein
MFLTYIQPLAQGGQLYPEHVDDGLSRLATIWNSNPFRGTRRNLDHVLKRRVFERLNGL